MVIRSIIRTLIFSILLGLSSGSLFNFWRYDPVCFPEEDYNRDMSECDTDQDCKDLKFPVLEYPPDTIMMTLNK